MRQETKKKILYMAIRGIYCPKIKYPLTLLPFVSVIGPRYLVYPTRKSN